MSDDVRHARARLESTLSNEVAPTGPTGVIHGDLFRDNVLFDGERIVALLDFESASIGSFAFDLMVTILSFCFGDHLDEALACAMTRGYLEEAAFSPDELACFGRRALSQMRLFACARFTTTRITDFELRPKGTGIYKDFRRFLHRMDAIEALGKRGLATFLQVPGFAKVGEGD